jgi:hypothetical protein
LWVAQERRRRSQPFADYLNMTAALYEAICETSGKPIVVDSSKSPLRAFALLFCRSIDLYLIHLVRDGRGVVWSYMKPKSRKKDPDAGIPRDFFPRPSWKTSLLWIFQNYQSDRVAGRAGSEKALRLHYEQLNQNPVSALDRIGGLVGEDLSDLATALAEGRPMLIGHTVAGNSIRMSSSITLRSDVEWTRKLPDKDRRIFWLLAGWWARRYGYRREGNRSVLTQR